MKYLFNKFLKTRTDHKIPKLKCWPTLIADRCCNPNCKYHYFEQDFFSNTFLNQNNMLIKNTPIPFDSIRLAVLTVSPNRQYFGKDNPTIPETV